MMMSDTLPPRKGDADAELIPQDDEIHEVAI